MTLTAAHFSTVLKSRHGLGNQVAELSQLAVDANTALRMAGPSLTKEGAAAYLATLTQESGYFRYLQELGRKLRYDPYRGRTFIGITWAANYALFGDYCLAKGLVSDDDYFVKNPTKLAEYKWAWLGPSWFFSRFGAWSYANAGNFLAVSNLVNRGDAGASGYPAGWSERQACYNAWLALGESVLLPGSSSPAPTKNTRSSIDGSPADVTAAALALWTKYHGKVYQYSWPELPRLGGPSSYYWCGGFTKAIFLDGTGWNVTTYCPEFRSGVGLLRFFTSTAGWQEVPPSQAQEGDWNLYTKRGSKDRPYHTGYVWKGPAATGDPNIMWTIEGNTSEEGDFDGVPAIPRTYGAGGALAKKKRYLNFNGYLIRTFRPPYQSSDANPTPTPPPDSGPPDAPPPPSTTPTTPVYTTTPVSDSRLWQAASDLTGSPAFLVAMESDHTVLTTCDIWVGDDVAAMDVPLVLDSSNVKVDRSAQSRRSADVTIQADAWNSADGDLPRILATPGAELRIETGLTFPNGRSETVPVFTGQVRTVGRGVLDGQLRVTGNDYWQKLIDDSFLSMRVSNKDLSYVDQMCALISETDPGAYFSLQGYDDSTSMLEVVWDASRSDAITKIAWVAGCEVFASPVPHLWVVRPIATAAGFPKWSFGVGSTLVSLEEDIDWSGVFNGVTVKGERADNPGVEASSTDDDPASPTFYGGPFGRHNREPWTSSLLATVQDCQAAADSLIASVAGTQMSLSWEALRNPLLEAGDPVEVFTDTDYYRMVLESFTIPLGGQGITQCTARAQQVVPS